MTESFIETAHLNGGKDWFGYIYRSTTRPRLSYRVKYFKKTHGIELTWMVDGIDVRVQEAKGGDEIKVPYQAEEALAVPVVLEPAEAEALAKVPAHGLRAKALWDLIGISNYLALSRKGQLVGKDGIVSRVAT